MKALLVLPPIHDFYTSPDRLTALGLKTLVPFLETAGWEWELINFPLSFRKGRQIPFPKELAYLKPFLISGETGPLSWFRSYNCYGPPEDQAVKTVLDRNPDLVLISCPAWAYAHECRTFTEDLKKVAPELKIILGGPGAAALPEYFADSDGADFIFIGEAEPGFAELLKLYSPSGKGSPPHPEDIPNLYTGKHSHPCVFTEEKDLNPVWSTGPSGGSMRSTIMLSRGCPRKCRFCSNFLTSGRCFRKVPIDKVLDSIRQLPAEGKLEVNFEDDNLLLAPEYFLEILRALKNYNNGFSFSAENGLDYTLLNPDLLKELKALGLKQLNISLAVSSQGAADYEKRFFSPGKFEDILKEAVSLNLPVITYFICGLSGDTPEGTVDTLLYLDALPTKTGISLFYPVPGLPGLENHSFRDIFPGLCRGSAANPWNSSLTTSEMITAFRLSRLSNLGKAGKLSSEESKLLGLCMETGRIHTLIKKRGRKDFIPVPGLSLPMMDRFFSLRQQIRPIG